MSSGSVIKLMANDGFCKPLSKVNILGWQLAAKWTDALDYVFIFCLYICKCTYNMQRTVK